MAARLAAPLLSLSLPRPKPAILALALTAALAAGTALWLATRPPAFPLPAGELLPEDGAAADLLLSYVSPELSADAGDDSASLPPPPASMETRIYTFKKGDSLSAVAKRFGLALDSIVSLNGIASAVAVRAGTQLRIPSMDGVLHRVAAGESIGSIAARYRVDPTRLVDANDLGSSVIRPGQAVFIPGARLPESQLRQVLGERVAWPLRGPLSSTFGYRPNPFTGFKSFHAGLDIVAAPGTPVRAAMDGLVADVGYNANYGNYVIMTHSGGLQTLYGHLTQYSVKKGQRIGQGAELGTVGNTGYSTGPHLHFGLFRAGAAINPLKMLK